MTGRYQGSFIAHIGNIGTGKSGGLAGEEIDVDGVVGLDLAQVDIEYGHAVGKVGEIYKNLSVETSGAEEGFVRMSTRLVAARIMTPLLVPKPSISVRS